MIVILNNGTRLKIARDFAQSILQALGKDNSRNNSWHIGIDANNNKMRGFNMSQVSAVCEEEDIISDPTGLLEKLVSLIDKEL